MIGMIELVTHADASAAVVVREFAVEMSVGLALGMVGGWLLAAVLRRIRLPSAALHPLLALALAAALYGVTSRLHGSGFLAVFLAGLIVGGGTPRHETAITSFTGPLASLAEIAVFVALGLTVSLGSLSGRTWFEGVVLALCSPLLLDPSLSSSPLPEPGSLGLSGRSWPGAGSRERYPFSWPRSPS